MDLSNLLGYENYLTLKAIKGNHFGKSVLSVQCTASQILKFIEIDRTVQRDLIDQHVSDIQKYIQYGMDGNNIYFPPIILSARGKGNYNEEKNEYKLNFDDRLALLDGQHRIKAFEIIIKRLEIRNDQSSIIKLNYAKNFPFTLQIFVNISKEEEKQLFTDVNTKSAKVSNTLLIMYKNNDLCGELVKDIIENHPTISSDLFEIRAKYTRTKMMTAAGLLNIIITLNEGIMHTGKINSKITLETYNMYREKTIEFLSLLHKFMPITLFNRDKYIIYISKVLSGIAYFLAKTMENYPELTMEEIFNKVIFNIDWSQKNTEFEKYGLPFNENTRKYNISNGIRGINAIVNYLNSKLEEVL